MNFKKYHVSKNLFDKTDTSQFYDHTSLAGEYWAYSSQSAGIVIRIPCKENTTYTLACDVATSVWRIFLINTDSTPNSSAAVMVNHIVRDKPSGGVYSFTTASNTKYILFQTGSSVFNDAIDIIMLNEGSQPLPYEPYSSEVWHDIPHYIHNTSTDTITTLPDVIYANDNNATVGLKGNMEQSGTPTPTTPIQPQSCGERTGNLFDKSNTDLIFIGTTLAIANEWNGRGGISKVIRIPCEPLTVYTISGESESSIFRISLSELETAPDPVSGSVECIDVLKASSVSTQTFTTTANTKYILVQVSAATFDDYINVLMLNTGSTPLPYEPYGYKIPILSAGQTTPVYLGKFESTRNTKKLVLDGTENWLSEEGNGRYSLPNITSLVQFANQLCTHFQLATSYSDFYFNDLKFGVSNRPCLLIHYIACQTVSAFKAFLAAEYAAGHPVTVWYVLPTPTTGIVNEPLRKIGDYADEVSGITIPTIAGTNTLSVDTTLQPSEVTATYKGWHPASAVHERENGAWD